MNQEERKQLIARAAVRMTVKPAERPTAPPPRPRLDSYLPGEIARLEAVVAEREKQIAAVREEHGLKCTDYHARLGELERRVNEAGYEMKMLELFVQHLRAEAQAVLDEAAAECQRVTAEAEQRAEAARVEARAIESEYGHAGLELEHLQVERQRVQDQSGAELGALLDQVDRLQHGRYADARRRLPELRERLAARRAEVEAWEAAHATPAPEPQEPAAGLEELGGEHTVASHAGIEVAE